MNKNTLPELIAQNYEQHKRLLFSIVHQYPNVGTFDERLSLANEAWLRAYYTYNPHNEQGASFATWVRLRTRGVLIDETRRRCRHNREQSMEGLDCPQRARFDLDQFLSLLSPDASHAVREALRMTGRNRGVLWQRLFTTLREQGWNRDRILRAFNEVGEALE